MILIFWVFFTDFKSFSKETPRLSKKTWRSKFRGFWEITIFRTFQGTIAGLRSEDKSLISLSRSVIRSMLTGLHIGEWMDLRFWSGLLRKKALFSRTLDNVRFVCKIIVNGIISLTAKRNKSLLRSKSYPKIGLFSSKVYN